MKDSPCDKTNGKCTTGCEGFWTGVMCKGNIQHTGTKSMYG